MAFIFISYAEEDQETVAALVHALEALGHEGWYYERDSVPDISYIDQTIYAISRCDAFVILLSPDSLGSSLVDIELHRAFENRKKLIPVLKEVTNDELLTRRPAWHDVLHSLPSLPLAIEVSDVVNSIIAELPGVSATKQITAGLNIVETASEQTANAFLGRYELQSLTRATPHLVRSYKAIDHITGETVNIDVAISEPATWILTQSVPLLKIPSHSNLFRIIDISEENGVWFRATSFYAHPTLAARLSEPIHTSKKLDFIVQLLDALEHLHNYGYLHGGIGANNVLFAADNRLILTDLHLDLDSDRGEGQASFTERAVRRKKRTRNDDLFDASKTISKYLTGGAEFWRGTSLRPWFPYDAPLVTAIDRGLTRDPTLQWQSAADFARELRRIMHLPLSATPNPGTHKISI